MRAPVQTVLFIQTYISMNSCIDLDLILVSVSGAVYVMYHINTRIRELLKRLEFRMGWDLSAWFVCSPGL